MKVPRLYLLGMLSFCSSVFATSTVEVEQKVVLITGSTGGIGKATTKAFYQDGWKVYAGYRKELSDECKELSKLEDIHYIHLDLTDSKSIDEATSRIIKENHKIDVLINNAGYGLLGVDEYVSMQDAKDLFDVNFFGALELIQKVTPHMKDQKTGHILNISSTSGVRAVPGLGLYAASKFALEAISESLAATLSPWNIKVSIIEPGTVDNSWGRNCKLSFNPTAEFISNIAVKKLLHKLIYLAKTGQPSEEIAKIILQAANTKDPDMRYQTSKKVEQTLSSKLSDLPGNQLKEQMTAFFQSLINMERVSPHQH